MLTLVEAISLAGDRTKQNDDASGAHGSFAWVIDGATDLHDKPLTSGASDAAWLAQQLNEYWYRCAQELAATDFTMRATLRHAARSAAIRLEEYGAPKEAWMSPTASALMVGEMSMGLAGLDIGDCRCFALDAEGVGHNAGSRESSTDDEQERARDASKRAGAAALLRDPDTMTMLRAARAKHNMPGGNYWVFGLQPECADHARAWTLRLERPAHALLCTDGFSALVDRYKVYNAGGLVKAALDKGLQELGRELRAIEAADASGAIHPRFKQSDDATALLLRLS